MPRTRLEMSETLRDRIEEAAIQKGYKSNKGKPSKEERERFLVEALEALESAAPVVVKDEDRKHIDRAVELGADRAELAATGLVWAAKSYASRQTSKAVQHDLDVEAMDDRELEE